MNASAAPADGASLPANVSALPLFAGSFPAVLACGVSCEWQVFELRDGAGLPVSSHVVAEPGPNACAGWSWLVPDQPLVVGAPYRLVFSDPCAPASCADGATHALREHGFTVIAAAPRPDRLATVTAGDPRVGGLSVQTRDGSCVTGVPAVSRTLAFAPSPGAVPLLPMTRWTIRVDGDAWGAIDYGGIAADGTVARDGRRPADVLFSRCGIWSALDDNGLSPGMHEITVLARIAGETADVTVAQLTTELSCETCTGLDEGTPCDDFEACTEDDRCAAGACSGTPTPGAPCDDLSSCTHDDACDVAGSCRGSFCDDRDPCTVDACMLPQGVCRSVPVPERTACDDADPCTAADACTGGACVGTPVCNGRGAVASGCAGFAPESAASLLGTLLVCIALVRPRRVQKTGP